jgi:hypothetical protein
VVEEGMMWIFESREGEGVGWLVVSWAVEGLLKWDFSTPISITSLEEEEPPLLCWHTPWLRIILHGRVSPI